MRIDEIANLSLDDIPKDAVCVLGPQCYGNITGCLSENWCIWFVFLIFAWLVLYYWRSLCFFERFRLTLIISILMSCLDVLVHQMLFKTVSDSFAVYYYECNGVQIVKALCTWIYLFEYVVYVQGFSKIVVYLRFSSSRRMPDVWYSPYSEFGWKM